MNDNEIVIEVYIYFFCCCFDKKVFVIVYDNVKNNIDVVFLKFDKLLLFRL